VSDPDGLVLGQALNLKAWINKDETYYAEIPHIPLPGKGPSEQGRVAGGITCDRCNVQCCVPLLVDIVDIGAEAQHLERLGQVLATYFEQERLVHLDFSSWVLAVPLFSVGPVFEG